LHRVFLKVAAQAPPHFSASPCCDKVGPPRRVNAHIVRRTMTRTFQIVVVVGVGVGLAACESGRPERQPDSPSSASSLQPVATSTQARRDSVDQHKPGTPEPREWLGDWLAKNNPLVINYLQGFADRTIGSKVDGVVLSDGQVVLRGDTYLGRIQNVVPGAHVYLFTHDNKPIAYVWVEPGGTPLELPRCPNPSPQDDEPQNVLSGDIYTWKHVQPDRMVVIASCPGRAWLDRVSFPKGG